MNRHRNVDRRNGDRLWDDDGREWQRLRTSAYYLSTTELQEALAAPLLPRVALQADHSPLEWPTPVRAVAILNGADTSFPGNGNTWAVTLWAPISGSMERLLVVEEVH